MNQSSSETTTITSFIVRFWREWAGDTTRWRGRIEHVESGQQVSFLEMADLLDFLGRFGIDSEATPSSGAKDDRNAETV